MSLRSVLSGPNLSATASLATLPGISTEMPIINGIESTVNSDKLTP
jgi:hypothetical protein